MRKAELIQTEIVTQLSTVIDPELRIDIVNLGLVNTIDHDCEGICLIELTLTTLGCPLTSYLANQVKEAVMMVPEVKNVAVEFVWEPAWAIERMSRAAKIALGLH